MIFSLSLYPDVHFADTSDYLVMLLCRDVASVNLALLNTFKTQN